MLSRVLGLWDRLRDYVTLGLFVGLVAVTILWRFSVGDLALEKEGRLRDQETYQSAQSAAEAKALRLKQEQEKKDRDKQEAADSNAAALRSKYDGILRRYAEAQRTISRTNLPGSSPTPEGSNGPGTSAVLPDSLTIPYKDAEICAENTARLEAVQKWATVR